MYLTLTSVVFEFKINVAITLHKAKFNFNKCCIWIERRGACMTLRDGFNFNKCCIWIIRDGIVSTVDANLTLTSVVFEFC